MDFNQLRATINADESTGESEGSIQLENPSDQSNQVRFLTFDYVIIRVKGD